jgi:hypothetical protein
MFSFIIILIIFIFGYLFFNLFFNLFYKQTNFDKSHIIKTLVRQAARWSTAAAQDENAMISVLHANYGAGYLWALRDIATDEEIFNATHIDVLKFRDDITKIQDYSTMKLMKLCPNYAPTQTYLTKIAKEI